MASEVKVGDLISGPGDAKRGNKYTVIAIGKAVIVARKLDTGLTVTVLKEIKSKLTRNEKRRLYNNGKKAKPRGKYARTYNNAS